LLHGLFNDAFSAALVSQNQMEGDYFEGVIGNDDLNQ
jgi:hypothetical protein